MRVWAWAQFCAPSPSSMAPKSSSGKGAGSSGKAGLKTSKLGSQPGSRRYSSEAKWTISDYKPQRQISEQELKKAREIFFSLDSDMSGSIEAEEIRIMLHSLGQNPTDEELQELIVRCLMSLAHLPSAEQPRCACSAAIPPPPG